MSLIEILEYLHLFNTRLILLIMRTGLKVVVDWSVSSELPVSRVDWYLATLSLALQFSLFENLQLNLDVLRLQKGEDDEMWEGEGVLLLTGCLPSFSTAGSAYFTIIQLN